MAVTKNKIESSVDTSVLNEDQKKAFNELKNFICNPKDEGIYVLKGWAGTGKTFCVSLLVKYVLETIHPERAWYKIAVTGPTNKSVRVIKKTTGILSNRVSFMTVHKLLGLTEKITSDGRQEFVNQGDFRPAINSVKLIIIDEVSMLNDDLFHKLLDHRNKVKIICMGDPAQIPPVGRPDCIPFRDELAEMYDIRTIELNKIMRQKEGNPIIESSVIIRNSIGDNKIPLDNISIVNEDNEGIEFLNLNLPEIREGFTDIVSKYYNSKEFNEDPEYVKIIAWRNATVARMNYIVRKTIYGEESATKSKIMIGEKLIANNPIIQDDEIIFSTNDEFRVEEFKIKDTKFYKIGDEEIILKYYETKVSYLDDDEKRINYYIDILHEDSETDFRRIADNFKKIAIEKSGKEKTWIKYYNFLRTFADVNYAYAITAHKSQGSTYNSTFVLEDDIDVNLDIIERNRIKYTAYTRSSKKLYVLKRF